MIAALEEETWVEGGRNQHLINDRVQPHYASSQTDEIRTTMISRKIVVHDYEHNLLRITKNKTTM